MEQENSCLFFPEHESSYSVDADFIRERANRFVSLLQFLANGETLRAVLLAFAALDALGGKSGFFCQADRLGILESALAF